MALTNELISQFTKITNDKPTGPKESTCYGTVTMQDGAAYVILDGSTIPTPVDTTSELKDGDRVTVILKNHTATVIGNMTSPSVRLETAEKLAGDASDAAKVATNYLVADESGLIVGNLTDDVLGANALIAPEGFYVRNGDTVLSSFEDDEIHLGMNSIDSKIYLCKDSGYIWGEVEEIGGEQVPKLGVSAKHFIVNTELLQIRSSTQMVLPSQPTNKSADTHIHTMVGNEGDGTAFSALTGISAQHYQTGNSAELTVGATGEYGGSVSLSAGHSTILTVYYDHVRSNSYIQAVTDAFIIKDGRLVVEGNVLSSSSVYSGGKTAYDDGETGALLSATGRLWLQGPTNSDGSLGNPYVVFRGAGSTEDDAYISYDVDTDYLTFGAATMYTFGNTVRLPNGVAITGLNADKDSRVNMAWVNGSDDLVLGGGGYKPNYIFLTPSKYAIVQSVLQVNSALFTGGKTTYNDKKPGAEVGSNGRIYLTGTSHKTDGVTPGLYFYDNDQTSSGASLTYDYSDDNINVAGATLSVKGTAVSLSGHTHGWTNVSVSSSTDVTINSHHCAYNKTIGTARLRLYVTIKPSEDFSAGTSLTIANVTGEAVPGYLNPLACYSGSTNSRRWTAAINSDGDILVRVNTTLAKGTSYGLYVGGYWPVVV